MFILDMFCFGKHGNFFRNDMGNTTMENKYPDCRPNAKARIDMIFHIVNRTTSN